MKLPAPSHVGVAIGVAQNSPPPPATAGLFRVRLHPTTSDVLADLPRPAIVFGGLPCERLASNVAAQKDIAYVLVTGPGGDEPGDEKCSWVDAIVRSPAHHHEICEAGERALREKQGQHEPRAITGENTFAWMGHTATLSTLESRLMRRLVQARGSVVSKEALAYDLWGNYLCDPGRAVDTHIYRMRKRIAPIPGAELETVRQRGFRLLLDPNPAINS